MCTGIEDDGVVGGGGRIYSILALLALPLLLNYLHLLLGVAVNLRLLAEVWP